jgi:isopentenyl-diphosphate delta-isomerase
MAAAQVLDQVNEQDQPIGTIRRSDVFRLHANFRVAHVFIFNPQGQLLLQEIAPNQSRHPGRWGSSIAAYVASGEDYLQAATRRLGEELGIRGLSLAEIGKTEMIDDGCHKFMMLFTCHHPGPFTIDSSHISGVEFVALPQVRAAVKENSWRFTPTFIHLLDFYTRAQPS